MQWQAYWRIREKCSILTCSIEQQQNGIKGNWESPGSAEHTKLCHGRFNWIHPWTIAVMANRYKRKVCEARETNRLKILNETDKTFKVLNRKNGDYITTNSWKPLFQKIGNDETNFDVKFCISSKTVFYCRFSYAGTWGLVNLFVGTKTFSCHISYENIDRKNSKIKILMSQETDRPWTDKTEQNASKQDFI